MAPFTQQQAPSIGMIELNTAKDYLKDLIPSDCKPSVGIVCGSGLGKLYTLLQNPVTVPYEDIPGFVRSTGKLNRNDCAFDSHFPLLFRLLTVNLVNGVSSDFFFLCRYS
jgi:hypothetical protein